MRITLLAAACAALTTAPAFAADMPAKAPIAPAAVPYSWTGFYAGVNVGWGWGRNDATFTGADPGGEGNDFISRTFDGPLNFSPITRSHGIDSHGAIGGAQIGYNWQFAPLWVAGLEADIQASGIVGDTTTFSPTVALNLTSHQGLNWFGTVRGRLGYLIYERLLVFGTGGLAYGETNLKADFITNGFGGANTTSCGIGSCISGQSSDTRAGWTAGVGFEWAFSNISTLKIEYLHIDLGDSTVLMTTAGSSAGSGNGAVAATFNNRFDIVRLGVNFRFGAL